MNWREEVSFGLRLRALRETLGLDRAELEERAGLRRRTLERIEQLSRAQVPQDPRVILRIARALGTTAEALVEGAEEPSLDEVMSGLVARHGRKKVLRAAAKAAC